MSLKLARGFTLPLEVITEATAIVATRGAGKSSASAVVVEEAFRADVQSVVLDRTGVYWGLRSSSDGESDGLGIYVLGGPHADVPLEPTAGKFIADLVVDSGHSFVLDLSDLSKSNAVKFSADFLERLYDRKARVRSTTLLIVDEAHFYAPQTPRGGFKGDSARLMGAMEDVVGLGRSRGLGVVLTTQRTQALNKAVLDLIETMFVMRMLSPRAREAVRDWIKEKQEEDRLGIIASLESLPTGTAWVWSPLRGILEKIVMRRIKTFDSYATPKPGQAQVEPAARAELDLGALGEQMRRSVERAKESDPRELRARVAEKDREIVDLRRALDDRPTEAVEVEKIVEVPKPVFNGEVETLEKVLVAMGSIADTFATAAAVVERAATEVNAAVTQAKGVADAKPAPARADRHAEPQARPARTRSRPAPAAAPPPRETVVDGDFAPTGPHQKILDAIAWLDSIGLEGERRRVAFLAGYKMSGTFAGYLSELSTAGAIFYPAAGMVALTETGSAHARPPDSPPTSRDIHDLVLAKLSGPQRKILGVLIEAYPDEMERAALAEATGYSLSGTFAGYLSELSSLGVIRYPSRGAAAADPVLFIE